MDPSKYISLHFEVKDVFQDYDFIYTDGFVSDDEAAAAAVIDNYQGGSAISGTPPPTAKQSATSRKVMHRHLFACSLGRARSRESA